MMPKEKLRRADVITSVLFVALGVSVIVGASQMPMSGTYGGRPVHWYTSPAFFPIILGTLLIVLSGGVFVRAVADGGHRAIMGHVAKSLTNLPQSIRAWRILMVWMILGGYILLISLHPFGRLSQLLSRLPLVNQPLTAFLLTHEGANYVVSSFLFLAVFMFFFYRSADSPFTPWRCLLILLLSLLVPWAVGYVFTEHLYTPLPWLDY